MVIIMNLLFVILLTMIGLGFKSNKIILSLILLQCPLMIVLSIFKYEWVIPFITIMSIINIIIYHFIVKKYKKKSKLINDRVINYNSCDDRIVDDIMKDKSFSFFGFGFTKTIYCIEKLLILFAFGEWYAR